MTATVATRTCTKCGQEKPATREHFNAYKRSSDGLRAVCKECQRADYRDYFNRNHDKVRAAIRQRDRAFQPERSRRQKEKRAADPEAAREADRQRNALRKTAGERRQKRQEERQRLALQAEESHRLREEEKARQKAADPRTPQQKQSEYQKRRRAEAWEQVRAQEKARQAKRKDKAREYQKTYNAANRDKIRTRSNAFCRRKRATNPTYRISENMSSGIWQSLKNGKEGLHWETLVGYTAAELMAHLEAQFLPGMTWENYGKFGWHVDHIRPISSFTFVSHTDPEFLECWALANLRPLWWEDNIRKKDKWRG